MTTTSAATTTDARRRPIHDPSKGLIYEWRGVTASSGRVTSAGPEPATYALSYADSAKTGERLRMTFDGRAVTEVSIIPKTAAPPHTIPVTKEQLEGVLDPLSGAFLSAHSDNPQRRFDGVQSDLAGVRRPAAL